MLASESALESASISASMSVSESTSVNTSLLTSDSISGSVSASALASTSTSTSLSMENIASQGQSASSKPKQVLPNTGASTSVASALLGALAAVTGIGLLAKKGRNDDEESR